MKKHEMTKEQVDAEIVRLSVMRADLFAARGTGNNTPGTVDLHRKVADEIDTLIAIHRSKYPQWPQISAPACALSTRATGDCFEPLRESA